MREYKISSAGQMTLPAEVRKRWDIQVGVGTVQAADLGTGVLMIPTGTEWALVEAYYPESELQKRAKQKRRQVSRSSRHEQPPTAEVEVFRAYNISRVGQLTVPASARSRWSMMQGGIVEATDLSSGLVLTPVEATDLNSKLPLTPPDTSEVLQNLVPIEMLEDGSWQYNYGGHLSVHLSNAYTDWQKERGRKLLDLATSGGSFGGYGVTRDNTALGKAIELFVVKDTMQAAVATAQTTRKERLA